MLRKYSILFGIIISILLPFIAAMHYRGGSQYDKNSTGYDWQNNYLGNLFSEKADNSLDNSSRIWAVCGMFFFIEFSKKIPLKNPAKIIKYFGAGGMLFAFLSVTPYHEIMIAILSTLALTSIFYITVFVFESKLHFFKILCIICLLAFYCCNYIYYTRNYLEFLPIMQKILLAIGIIWVLALEYFTKKENFQHIKTGKENRSE